MTSRFIPIILVTLAASLPADALELKDITYTTDGAGKVTFSHKKHMNKKKPKTAGFNCKACHNSTLEKNARYTMADMDKGKSCGACHNGKQAFSVRNCAECHKVRNVAFKVRETGPVTFSHTGHLRKSACSDCHNRLYRTGSNPRISMAEMEKGKSCGSCHNGKKGFALGNCTRCHPVKDRVYRLDAGNVTFSHADHLAMHKCGDCHADIFLPGKGNRITSMADMEKGMSCGACHDGSTAFTVAEQCDNCHK